MRITISRHHPHDTINTISRHRHLPPSPRSGDLLHCETEFSRLLNVAESTPSLYFSYDLNIRLSTQRLHELGDESKLLPLWGQADPRFLWDNYMIELLIDNKLDPYLLPLIQGSFHNF